MLPVASLLILMPLIFAAVTFFTKTKEQAASMTSLKKRMLDKRLFLQSAFHLWYWQERVS